MKQPKKDTSRMMTVEPPGFVRNEWLESRLALRDSDPAEYQRETPPALRATVERDEGLKQGRAGREL